MYVKTGADTSPRERLDLSAVTGKTVRDWFAQLNELDGGCVSVWYGDGEGDDGTFRFFVCMGWHKCRDGKFRVAWKIGRQSENAGMQSDLDVDFSGFANHDSGEVYDFVETLESRRMERRACWVWRVPVGHSEECGEAHYSSWDALAARIRREARTVYRRWR